MASCVLIQLPIDIVDIIIVYSKCPNTFDVLSSMFNKLKHDNTRARIIDKLLVRTSSVSGIYYRYKDTFHREYNKPSCICKFNDLCWKINGCGHRNNKMPSEISLDGRFYCSFNSKFYITIYTNGNLQFICRDKYEWLNVYLDGYRRKWPGESYNILD